MIENNLNKTEDLHVIPSRIHIFSLGFRYTLHYKATKIL